jgi:hypothetical protein
MSQKCLQTFAVSSGRTPDGSLDLALPQAQALVP